MSSLRTTSHKAFAALALIALLGVPHILSAQSRAEHLGEGDAKMAALKPAEALAQFDSALALDSTSFDALWRAAQAALELAEFEESASRRAEFFQRAEHYARAAVRADSVRVEGRFAAARVLGLLARIENSSTRRATLGAETYAHAQSCLTIAPKHPGCLHALGAWHGTVAALNPFLRRMAGSITGSRAFGSASWQEAERLLREAIREEPKRIVHRLELARVYAAQKKESDAEQELRAAVSGEVMDSNDRRRKAEAERELPG